MIIRGLIALAFGALSFGITEFVVMGLLPYISNDLNVTIGQSGHTVTAYALGVVFGVFAMLFVRKIKLKYIMVCIIIMHVLGNVITAFAPDYTYLLISRFIAGTPHGCFFGTAAIIAQRMASIGKGGTAMAIVIAGQTISNVFGVPLGTALAHSSSWRTIFYILIAWSVIVLISIIIFVPDTGKIEDKGFKSQFAFLKSKAPYLVFFGIFCINGGIFVVQSYISPILTDMCNVPLSLVPAILICTGISMAVLNLIFGHLCDYITAARLIIYQVIGVCLCMLLITVIGQYTIIGIILMCLIVGTLFGTSTPAQLTILRVSPGGQLLGVALGQVAFNFGNAFGAYAGSIPIDYNYPLFVLPIMGAIITSIAIVLFIKFKKNYEYNLIEIEKEHLKKLKAEQQVTS